MSDENEKNGLEPLTEIAGPENNYGQPISYDSAVSKPEDFDHEKEPTDDAPNGFLKDGRPWSPWGVRRATGRPRRRPAPSQRRTDLESAKENGAAGVAPVEVEVPAGGGVPKAEAAEERPGEAFFSEGFIVAMVMFLTGRWAAMLGRPDLAVSAADAEPLAKAMARASRWYGGSLSEKERDTWAVAICALTISVPFLAASASKYIFSSPVAVPQFAGPIGES